jgi:putative DNA primase/helicase
LFGSEVKSPLSISGALTPLHMRSPGKGEMRQFDIRSLARALGGDVIGSDSILCPGPGHSSQDRSLSVRLADRHESGFIVYSHADDPINECRDYVTERMGLAPWRRRRGDDGRSRASARYVPDLDEAAKHAKHLGFAKSIWKATEPLKGTIVEKYLVETRKLELPDTEAIRFHPRLKVTKTDQYAAAMVCILTGIHTDQFTGINRIFLTENGRKISNAVLGRASGSAIKIDLVEGQGLGIAEGIESAIAARFLYRPMWSVISAGGMRHFPVLAGIEHLEIFADNDFNGAGEAAAHECLERWETSADVSIVMPPLKGADIADFITDKKKVY